MWGKQQQQLHKKQHPTIQQQQQKTTKTNKTTTTTTQKTTPNNTTTITKTHKNNNTTATTATRKKRKKTNKFRSQVPVWLFTISGQDPCSVLKDGARYASGGLCNEFYVCRHHTSVYQRCADHFAYVDHDCVENRYCTHRHPGQYSQRNNSY